MAPKESSFRAYVRAFEQLAETLSENERRMLLALSQTEGRQLTAEELAQAAGYDVHTDANRLYGRLGRKIGEMLGWKRPQPLWTSALARGDYDEGNVWRWQVHPQAAQAIRSVFRAENMRNPVWSRDELILALDMYLRYRGNPPAKTSAEIKRLSDTLNQLGTRLWGRRSTTYRNPNGVYMKLMNFRRFDPAFTQVGKVGLQRGGREEERIWGKYAADPQRCAETARAIMEALRADELPSALDEDEWVTEAEEGRLLTRTHIFRERSRELVQARKTFALKRHERLACECCGFDFEEAYGERGEGFIECHHITPVHTLTQPSKTKIEDLALVCANCHRMIHRSRPWLTVEQLQRAIQSLRQGR